MGVLGGAFLATALIPLLELRQRSRLKFRIIQEHLGYPLLGSVPCLSSAMISERDRQDALISLIGEMYHSVQDNLKLLNSSGQIKTVVISSCRQQEGKSTLAAHLAVTMARLGRTVLLIDTNIFNPSLDKIFGTSNLTGLVDVIEDGALRLPEIKMSMTHLLRDHLHLLSSGTVSEGISNKLFTTKRLATILNYFSNNYDFIVIDTPSLEQSTLALTLGKLADGLLLVVNPDYVDKKYVHTVQKMKDSDPTVIGTVINNITAQGKAAKYPLQTKAYLSESREEYFLMRNQ
jgi:capsular exopolysaccharide synthesis family protein